MYAILSIRTGKLLRVDPSINYFYSQFTNEVVEDKTKVETMLHDYGTEIFVTDFRPNAEQLIRGERPLLGTLGETYICEGMLDEGFKIVELGAI